MKKESDIHHPNNVMPTKKKKPKPGRPTVYCSEVAEVILDHIHHGGFLEPFLDSRSDLPDASTVYRWLDPKSPTYNQEFCDAYARACEAGADYLVWEGLEILDNSTPDNAQVDKNRAGYRQWIAERRSKRWQGRQELAVSGGDKPIEVSVTQAHLNAVMPQKSLHIWSYPMRQPCVLR